MLIILQILSGSTCEETKFKSNISGVVQGKETPTLSECREIKRGWVRGLASAGARYEVKKNQPRNKKPAAFNVNTQHHANRAVNLAQEDLDHGRTHAAALTLLCCQCTGKHYITHTHIRPFRLTYIEVLARFSFGPDSKSHCVKS